MIPVSIDTSLIFAALWGGNFGIHDLFGGAGPEYPEYVMHIYCLSILGPQKSEYIR